MNTVRYAAWMMSSGYHVTVFAVESGQIFKSAQEAGIPCIAVRRNRKYADVLAAYQIGRLFRNHGIDLIWFRDTRDFDLLARIKRNNDSLRLLYHQAMQFGVSKKDYFHSRRFRSVDLWISTLNFLADQVRLMTNFPAERIHVVPLGVDTSILHRDVPAKKNCRELLGLPADAILAGVIGRIDPLKRQDVLIRALSRLREKYPNLHVVIAGEPTRNEQTNYASELRQLALEGNVSDRVHFLPHQSQPGRLYQSLDIFVMPSLGETFGTVTIEAMSFGLPVIGTNSSGTPDILGNGECGLLFAPDRDDELAEQISSLMDDPEKSRLLGQKARSAFHLRFSREASIGALIKLIGEPSPK